MTVANARYSIPIFGDNPQRLKRDMALNRDRRELSARVTLIDPPSPKP